MKNSAPHNHHMNERFGFKFLILKSSSWMGPSSVVYFWAYTGPMDSRGRLCCSEVLSLYGLAPL